MENYFNKTNKILLSICVCVFIISGMVFGVNYKVFATEHIIDSNINKINNVLNELYKKRDVLLESSNPYEYIEDDRIKPMYENLVSQGIDALPLIINKINNSTQNGLSEYIIAIAGEHIGKTELTEVGEDFKWATAKSWTESVTSHIKMVEEEYYNIINSNKSEESKISDIKSLGVYVVPYILESINENDTKLIEVVNQLSNGNEYVNTYEFSENNFNQWKNDNIKKYSDLTSFMDSLK